MTDTGPRPLDDAVRPRRSVLFLPASNERALEKSTTLDADVVCIDLEDAVAPDAKVAARELAVAAVQARRHGHRELVVRVNGVGTPWHDADVRAVAESGAAAVLVPKVETAAHVRGAAAAVASVGSPTRVWAMVETPRAVLHAQEIADAHERLDVLVLGTNDLLAATSGLRVDGRNPTLLAALSWTLLAARAAGLDVVDGVWNAIDDLAGFEAEARQARSMGFDGKSVIHPSQLAAANATFGPRDADVERAHRLVAAYESAVADGRGVVTFEGSMIEELHVRGARRLLALHRAVVDR